MLGDRVRLVALTGFGKEEDKEEATRAGFDAHLTKPADGASLAEGIFRVSSVERHVGIQAWGRDTLVRLGTIPARGYCRCPKRRILARRRHVIEPTYRPA